MSDAKKVKVKILRYVGTWTPGEIIEVSPEEAAVLCKPSEAHNGHEVEVIHKAMELDKIQKLEALPVDISKLTQKDMDEMGLKNIVHTPLDESVASKPEKKSVEKAPAVKAKAAKQEEKAE